MIAERTFYSKGVEITRNTASTRVETGGTRVPSIKNPHSRLVSRDRWRKFRTYISRSTVS